MKPPSVCFVCPGATDLFAPDPRAAGGAELQLLLLGRELARRGRAVSFVVRARPGLDGGPIRLVPAALRADLPRGIGRVVNSARLWAALGRAGADVYVQRGADAQTLDVALFALARGRRFVFMAAHDDDFLLRTIHTDRVRNQEYRQGLSRASAVVAQTDRQRDLARERFRRRAEVVPNAVEIPAACPPPGDGALWVGMLRPEKRPEAVLELARALPSVRFTVVGGAPTAGAPGAEAARAFLRRAARLPNVACAGVQPPGRMDAFYARAAVLVNTATGEGFPNAFLEAWARGRPVATAGVDPDETICRHGLGIHARGIGALARALEGLLGDPARLRRMGEAARRHVEARHAVGVVVDRLEAVLDRAGRSRGRAGTP
jgi:glycosyltransferase involved in cell wall biosynthesis